MDVLDIARFWSHVEVGHYTDCWPWRKWVNGKGYGEVKIDGKAREAHRVAFEIAAGGELPSEVVVHHTCVGNPLCCNPTHLVSGTHADTVRDRCIRDRSAKGEKNGRAKLKEEEVRQIRSLSYFSADSVGMRFGVSGATVQAIRSGRIWKHVR